MRFVLHALLTAVSFGALHLWLSRRGALPLVRFCALAAVAHAVVGLVLMAPAFASHAGRSWTTLAWPPLFALGLFAAGAVLAVAWLGLVKGLERAVARRAGGGPPA